MSRRMHALAALFATILLFPGVPVAAEDGEDGPAFDPVLQQQLQVALRGLRADSWSDREAASQALQQLGPQALPYLEPLLQDPDPEIRLRARYLFVLPRQVVTTALDRIQGFNPATVGQAPAYHQVLQLGPYAVGPLLEQLLRFQSHDTNRRGGGVTTLNQREMLIGQALKDLQHPTVPEQLLETLGRDLGHLHQLLAEILRAYPEEAYLPVLVRWLEHPDSSVRYNVYLLFARFDQDQAEADRFSALLARGVQDPDPRLRAIALQALGRMGRSDGSVPVFLLALGDPDRTVRLTAIRHLAGWRVVEARQRLLQLVDDGDEGVACLAVLALGELGDGDVAEQLMPLLTGPRPRIQEATVKALGRLRYLPAERPLVALTDGGPDVDERVRVAAFTALGRLGTLTAFEVLTSVADNREVAWAALAEMGNEDVARYLGEELGRTPDDRSRRLVLDLLTQKVRHPAAGPYLMPLLEEQHLASLALDALVACDYVEAAPRIVELGRARPMNQRQEIVEALGDLRARAGLAFLVEELEAAETELYRREVAYALGRLGWEEADEVIVELANQQIQEAQQRGETLEEARGLNRLGIGLLYAGEYQAAADAFRRIIDLLDASGDGSSGLRAIAHYNLACSASLQGDAEAAIDQLEEAVEHGYATPYRQRNPDLDHMKKDSDLDPLRAHPRFRALVEDIEARTFRPALNQGPEDLLGPLR